jgi:hypothetical protein
MRIERRHQSVDEQNPTIGRPRSVRWRGKEDSERPWLKYSAGHQSLPTFMQQQRWKREQHNFFNTDSKNGLYEVRTCSLYMQADQKLWSHIFAHEGQKNYERLKSIAFSLLYYPFYASYFPEKNYYFKSVPGGEIIRGFWKVTSVPSCVFALEGKLFEGNNDA